MRKNSFTLSLGLLLILIIGIFIGKTFLGKKESHPEKKTYVQNTSNPTPSLKKKPGVPDKVYRVYDYILKYHKAPKGYVGGREFLNRERKLPRITKTGQRIRYREWDVNEKKQGKNRGRERLVTGDDESAWYTKDHYNTFISIK